MADTLILKECRFDAKIGVFSNERSRFQPLSIDVELGLDTRASAKSDRMSDTVDYRTVHALIKKHIASAEYFLIETLAEKLAALILKKNPMLKSVTLTIRKPQPMKKRNGAWVGIRITRSR